MAMGVEQDEVEDERLKWDWAVEMVQFAFLTKAVH